MTHAYAPVTTAVTPSSPDRPPTIWPSVDPDGLYQRVKAAGPQITRELQDTHYGNRTFTVADPWSVSWSFGTYPGS